MTDDTRDLTEQELSYLGFEFRGVNDPEYTWALWWNGVLIMSGSREFIVSTANRIARAQGIQPPAFAVGDRVVYGGEVGQVVEVGWGLNGQDVWRCRVTFEHENGNGRFTGEYEDTELERLT